MESFDADIYQHSIILCSDPSFSLFKLADKRPLPEPRGALFDICTENFHYALPVDAVLSPLAKEDLGELLTAPAAAATAPPAHPTVPSAAAAAPQTDAAPPETQEKPLKQKEKKEKKEKEKKVRQLWGTFPNTPQQPSCSLLLRVVVHNV